MPARAPEQRVVGGQPARELQRVVEQRVARPVDADQQVERRPGSPAATGSSRSGAACQTKASAASKSGAASGAGASRSSASAIRSSVSLTVVIVSGVSILVRRPRTRALAPAAPRRACARPAHEEDRNLVEAVDHHEEDHLRDDVRRRHQRGQHQNADHRVFAHARRAPALTRARPCPSASAAPAAGSRARRPR